MATFPKFRRPSKYRHALSASAKRSLLIGYKPRLCGNSRKGHGRAYHVAFSRPGMRRNDARHPIFVSYLELEHTSANAARA